MPPRVVTADLESLLGVPVLGIDVHPYRDGAAVPGPLTNGRFITCLVQVPAGVTDAGELHANAHELPPQAVARLRNTSGGHLHEFWGHPRRTTPLTQEEADAGPRLATVTLDLGALLNARIDDARPIERGDGRVVPEVLLESPNANATRPSEHVYDALEDHPEALAAVVAAYGAHVRRQSSADAPPAWSERRPVV